MGQKVIILGHSRALSRAVKGIVPERMALDLHFVSPDEIIENSEHSILTDDVSLVIAELSDLKTSNREQLEQLRAILPSIPILAIDTYEDPHLIASLKRSGATDYIPVSRLAQEIDKTLLRILG